MRRRKAPEAKGAEDPGECGGGVTTTFLYLNSEVFLKRDLLLVI